MIVDDMREAFERRKEENKIREIKRFEKKLNEIKDMGENELIILSEQECFTENDKKIS